MIRIVRLDTFDEKDIDVLTRTLYQAFGVGSEDAGRVPLPPEAKKPDGRYDAELLLAEVEPVKTFADDKILYLTHAPLSLRPSPLGEPPCYGFSQYGGERAVVSVARLPQRGVSEAAIEAWQKRLGRESVHMVGHLWNLHHCYDPRCAEHPSWSPNLPESPSLELCNFCREKSERKIRLGKS